MRLLGKLKAFRIFKVGEVGLDDRQVFRSSTIRMKRKGGNRYAVDMLFMTNLFSDHTHEEVREDMTRLRSCTGCKGSIVYEAREHTISL